MVESQKNHPIRVLVVDDSLVCRELLSNLLNFSDKIHVVATAASGKEAIALNLQLKPDLITMDVDMPGMDGFATIEEIMQTRPAPVLVVTSSPIHQGVNRTFRTLEVGALDLMQKPDLEGSSADELRNKVIMLAKIEVRRRSHKNPPKTKLQALKTIKQDRSVIAITSSTGGPRTLQKILSSLPRHYPYCILITQHLPYGFSSGFKDWLNSQSALEVTIARENDGIHPTKVYLAPSGTHLIVRSKKMLGLSTESPWKSHRPSGSVMYRSLARHLAQETIGMILSGMGSDGADGLLELKRAGGFCIAQDRNSSLVYGMPKAAVDLGAVDNVLDIDGIVDFLLALGD